MRRHARAGIGDAQHHILADGDLVMLGSIAFVEMRVVGFQCQLAAIGHGVTGIDAQVQDGVFELSGVDKGRP